MLGGFLFSEYHPISTNGFKPKLKGLPFLFLFWENITPTRGEGRIIIMEKYTIANANELAKALLSTGEGGTISFGVDFDVDDNGNIIVSVSVNVT